MLWVQAIGGGVVALAIAAGQPGRAEDIPAAVGRISYSDTLLPDAAICSGFLVAPDLVLTAAHCVRSAADTPETIRFDAGFSSTGPAARRRGASVILGGAVQAPGLSGLWSDVALVVLDAPLPPADFPPLPLAAPSAAVMSLIGFDRTAPDLPIHHDDCRSLRAPLGLVALECRVVSGNSGAPVLERDGTGWRAVAVMVASAEGGPIRSWAVVPPPTLRLQIPPLAIPD
jgi:protease YdgD